MLGCDPLTDDLHIEVWRRDDKVRDLEPVSRADACAPGPNDKLAKGGKSDIGTTTVCDQMNVLDLGLLCEPLDDLLEVEDCELAGFAVVGVAEEAGIARRPSVDDRQSFAAEEMPQLRQRKGGVVEGVVLAMHVKKHVLAWRQRHVVTEQIDSAARRPQRQIHQFQQRRFAGPRRPRDIVKCTRLDMKTNVPEHFRPLFISQAYILKTDHKDRTFPAYASA